MKADLDEPAPSQGCCKDKREGNKAGKADDDGVLGGVRLNASKIYLGLAKKKKMVEDHCLI